MKNSLLVILSILLSVTRLKAADVDPLAEPFGAITITSPLKSTYRAGDTISLEWVHHPANIGKEVFVEIQFSRTDRENPEFKSFDDNVFQEKMLIAQVSGRHSYRLDPTTPPGKYGLVVAEYEEEKTYRGLQLGFSQEITIEPPNSTIKFIDGLPPEIQVGSFHELRLEAAISGNGWIQFGFVETELFLKKGDAVLGTLIGGGGVGWDESGTGHAPWNLTQYVTNGEFRVAAPGDGYTILAGVLRNQRAFGWAAYTTNSFTSQVESKPFRINPNPSNIILHHYSPPDGPMILYVLGEPGQKFFIETSLDLVHWESEVLRNGSGDEPAVIPAAGYISHLVAETPTQLFSNRFYRSVSVKP